jgi:asparagine synthase (glutamine-hydrolysing)
MCGIAGKLHLQSPRPVERSEIADMLVPMRHRGPDGDGILTEGPVGLGHLRLSIIDLEAGAQPLSNEDASVWIVFNGEIYNYLELREQLLSKGHVFRTQSDTEVIVHLYEDFGPDCVNQLQGMFAFAIWDRRAQTLLLARDRVGIKPLYYYQVPGVIAFASELKALLTTTEAPSDLNHSAVDAFWCFNYLPGQLTMFRGILKLLPGHLLVARPSGHITVRQYWDLSYPQEPRDLSLAEAAEELSELLRRTIRSHMIADVPVGFLVSGGVDSSAVLSFAAKETQKAIHTFTIGFEGQGVVDERPYARLMAERVGSRHFEATLSAQEFWDCLPTLFWHLDEPVCEPPAVALYLISKLARQHVKVLLSGEGGDEAFGGYPNYPNQLAVQSLRHCLGPMRHWLGPLATQFFSALRQNRLALYTSQLNRPVSDYYWSRVGSPQRRYANQPASTTAQYTNDLRAVLDIESTNSFMSALFATVRDRPLLDQLLYVDTKTWLPDDLLIKADKMTMASSLELRVPLLDHKVLEYACSLRPSHKVSGRSTKRVLKAAFASILPSEILTRKKAGFPVPYGRWLAVELHEATRELLLDSSSFVSRYFTKSSIEDLVDSHKGQKTAERELFSLLSLELWHRSLLSHKPCLASSSAVAATAA